MGNYRYPAEDWMGGDLYRPPLKAPRSGMFVNGDNIRLLVEGDIFLYEGAQWLVEQVVMSGGGTQSEPSGAMSVYSDEYTVCAVKLRAPEWEYDKDGDRIRFYQTGNYYGGLFRQTQPEVVGRMYKTWMRE